MPSFPFSAVLLLLLLIVCACQPVAEVAVSASVDLKNILGVEDGSDFAKADPSVPLVFPRDHGAHEKYRHEWWYVSGNLQTRQGERFGYQLTFFRLATSPQKKQSASAWNSNQVYMAHFAVTDSKRKKFYSFERFNRHALGLAGAHSQPFKVWLDNWQLASTGESLFPLRVLARADGVSVDLKLTAARGPVLQGQSGFSQKGPEQGNASHYYSFTRVPSSGLIHLGQQVHEVQGNSWIDREWGSSMLADKARGWDWFALQLDDGTDMMFYRLRKMDGSAAPWSQGLLLSADGQRQHLALDQLNLSTLSWWKSPTSGICYPTSWRMQLAEKDLVLLVKPVLENQELEHAFVYWEGAVDVTGTSGKSAVKGMGYMELTGYAQTC